MRVASLFTGAGGADLGFIEEGFDIVFANEIWERAIETYQKNTGHTVYDRAVASVADNPLIVPNHDVLIGGPPCQSFSNARTGGYSGGYRSCSGMENVKAMMHIAKVKQPKIIILENAPTLSQPNMTHICNLFFELFKDSGYHVNLWRLNAQDYGVPQSRTRCFFTGIRNDLYESGKRFTRPVGVHYSHYWAGWGDFLGFVPNAILLRRADKIKGKRWDEASYPVIATETMAIRFNSETIHKTSGALLSAERDALRVKQRYMSVGEMELLQGFPVDFIFTGSSSEKIKQIGNAWCVNVSRALARECRRILC